jgi:superfamily II RNA helicase
MSYLTIYDNKTENKIEDPSITFKFPLDLFQNEACYRISKNENVFVTAHTGCGKTVVALYAIAHTLKQGKKVIYTSPTKSLSNQKYDEFTKYFSNVGILTGDIKLNPDANCIIMTTEILLNILFKPTNSLLNSSINIDSIGAVIFDEVHYINDPDRGKVWEETLVLLPSRVNLILLSATVDKADKMAEWLGNIKQKPIHLITTLTRVIPLKHYFWIPEDKNMLEIIDEHGNFHNYDEIKRKYKTVKYSSIINEFIYYLNKNNMLPAIYFKFSRKQCEQCAQDIIGNFVTHEERKEIDLIFRNKLTKFKDYYGHLQQYNDVYNQLLKGIVYHHSGLIPILKEIIEILYAKGLIKILFATETFAVGVNMPAKTVIFNDLEKFDNNGLRHLRTDEYLQMSGRAGRRGLDKFGTVIILPTMDLPNYITLKNIMSGKSPSIKSKFIPSYQFILKALHNNELSIDKFIKTTLFSTEIYENINQYEKQFEEIDYKEYENIDKNIINEIEKYIKMEEKINNKFIKLNNKDKKHVLKNMKIIEQNPYFKDVYNIVQKIKIKINKKDDLNRLIDYNKNFIINDINKIINILKNGYLDDNNKLTDKGLIAIEINDCNPIIFTEIIYNKYLEDCNFEEIIAILASFIEEKSTNNSYFSTNDLSDIIPDNVIELLSYIDDENNYMIDLEKDAQLNIPMENKYKINLDFIKPAYMWAKGYTIKQIYQITDIYEGNFVRGILRINKMVENMLNIAENLKYYKLKKILEGYEEKLIRDIVTINSLYITF